MAPNRPTLLSRSISTRTIRIALLFGLIAVTASVLSTTSLAGTISQKFFTRAVALVTGEQMAPASHTLAVEETVPAPVESTTMLVERRGHTATRLADGRVLIAGGENGTGTLNETEIYDPAAGTFSAAANMGTARADQSATLLADGRVLIAGGHNGATSLASTEIFDPSSGAFTNGPSMSVARAGHSATLFANGRVLVAGGDSTGSAEIFNAGTFTATGSLGAARSMHSAALLQDGRVLIIGGRDGNGDALLTGEIFDTPAGTFSDVGNALKAARVRAHLRVLFDGKVQIIGGNNDGSMELYDPLYEGFGGYAHVLPEGDTCVGLSGQIQNTQTRAALFHNGQTDALFDRSGHTITELNGQALVLGGANSSGAVLSSSAVLVSSLASISTDKMDYAPGETAHITGRGFQPGEVVRLKIHEDPHTPQERGFDATADADGNFSGDYLVMEYDLDMKFIVGARGLTSGATAQTTMTDSNNFTVTPASQTVAAGSVNTFVWTFTAQNAANVATTTFTIPAGWTAPQTAPGPGRITITAGTCAASLNNISGQVVTINQAAGGCNNTTTFTLTYSTATAPSPAITTIYTFANQHGNSPTVTVTAAPANVNTTTTVANATATYGDASVTLNATVTPASGPAINSGSVTFTVKQGATTIGVATTDNTVVAGAASVSYALPAGTNAGAYTIEASYTPGAGFNASSGTGSLTINKRAATWTTNAASKTYGDADPSPLTTGSGTNFVAADNVTATYSRVAGENASPPTYHITATLSATPASALNNYTITNNGAEFTINKRAATWTTNAASKTYGDADPSPLTTGSGTNFVAADNVTATYSRAAGENASPPTYHITATLSATPASALNNYTITNDGAEFTINKRAATWTTNPASKTYGDADPSPLTTGSGTNFVAADNVTATYSRAAGENASPPTYHITATLSATPAAALNNYIITNDGAEFTINKRLATWTTNPASKTYGDADPSPLTTGSGTNFVAADNVTATYSRAAGENASPPTYHITATLSATPAAALNNYIITNDGAEFTINKRLATWTTNPASKTYGDPDPSPLTTGSGTNFVAADNVTATYSRAAGENASPPTYHITATLSATPAAALNNYIITNDGAEFTINKRLATWTTNPASKTYGDPDPSPLTTGSGTNFVAADNVTATYSRAAGENASPPTYHITATLSATPTAALNNYIITNDGAEFTINKRLATWTTNAASKTYGDADPSPLTTGSGTNFVAADNVTATYSRAAGENASPPTYHITATLSATPAAALNNYIITNDGAEFTINKRLATWTTNPASKTYGDPDPSPLTTGSGTNFVAADNVTATYSRAAGENASPPTYHITATLSATPAAALNNYIITNDGAEFTINKRLATWTTNPASKTYGDPDPSPLTTGSGTNFVAADNVTATYSRVAGENASPPTYHITATLSATPLSALDNYIITNDGAEFTINKRLATWTTNPNSKTYGDPDPSPITTGSGSNFVAADNVTATYSRAAGENASPPTYHITATLSATPLSALDNYIITNDGAEFTINKRLATWTTNPNSKTYGDPDPSPITTGSGSNFVAADNVTATYSRAAGENASPPTYHITATLSATPLSALDNYIITNDGAEFSINKRLATWATNPASKTYGDADPSPLTTGSGSNFVAADNVTATYSRVAGENASPPTYHITATLSATPAAALNNYIITNDGAEFTINKRLATWTTNPNSKSYGDADPSPLTTGSGSNFVAADNVTATYSRVAGENASPPTYHITATLSATPAAALDNYIITNDGNEFTINKRLATWTTNPASKTYGDADPSPLTTGSGSNFIAADNVTATYSRVAGENASPPTYHITATLSATPASALNNYTITNNGAEFTINKRAIQVTANAGQFKIYGDPDPTFTYTLTSGTLAFTDTFTGALSRVAGQNVGLYALTVGSLHVNDGNGGNNYNLTFVSKNFEIKKRPITVKADPKSKVFGSPDPVFTYQITSGSLAFTDAFTGALTRDPGELVGQYTIKIGTLAINDGNGGLNYTLTFVQDKLTILTACSVFNGFLSPIGGAVEFGNGGSFNDPVRAFKLNSTIPVKFTAICFGVPLTTGVHTLQASKYSTATDGDTPIDATPTDAATDGNQFRLTGTEWHFNMNTKALGGNAQGTYLLKATLFDGSSYSVWISIKK